MWANMKNRHFVMYCLAIFISMLYCAFKVSAAPLMLQLGLTFNQYYKTYSGYTIYCVEGGDKIFVIDMDGTVVHTWSIPGVSPVMKPLPKGHIMAFVHTDVCFKNWCQVALREYDWEGNMVWEFRVPEGISSFTHDFQHYPNGNTLILASQYRSIPEFIPRTIRDNVLLEIDKAGNILWQWSTLEHFHQLGISDRGKRMIVNLDESDVFHTNSIQKLPHNWLEKTDARFSAGNILVSQRLTNIVYIIDKVTGDIVWQMSKTIGQHHASMIPPYLPGGGNILLFDNGGHGGYPPQRRASSKVHEINPSKQETVWLYTAATDSLKRLAETFFSQARGSVQRLPNDNTLIVESAFGRIFEVTPDNEVVWEYVNPLYRRDQDDFYTNQIYRAYRVDYTWPTGEVGPSGGPFPW
jgi:hypothetical protein